MAVAPVVRALLWALRPLRHWEAHPLPTAEEVAVAVEPDRPARSRAGSVRIVEADGHHAVLVFSGVLDAHALPELEERLLDPRLRQAGDRVLDMSGLERIELACAYGLLRAVTVAPEAAVITVRGARRGVVRTLRQAGLDAVATFES
ncbi:STAS domain-containing protein [Streptomyces pristinaespiralis]|nr:STAS domain-containing protein [Streptomyces pristinaespiralis]